MYSHHRMTKRSLLIGAAVVAILFGLLYQKHSMKEDGVKPYFSQQEEVGRLRESIMQLTEDVKTLSHQKGVVSNPSATAVNQQIALLSQQVTDLQTQFNTLTQNDFLSTTATNIMPEEIVPSSLTTDPALVLAQRQSKAEKAVQDRIQQLEYTLQNGKAEDARMTALQQNLEEILEISDTTRHVSLQNIQCSQNLCRFTIVGQPTDGKDIMIMFLEQNAFQGDVSAYSVPDTQGNLTFYIGSEAQLLPEW